MVWHTGVRWLLLCAMALLSACSKQPADRLQGRWVVDLEKTAATLELPADATPAADPKNAVGMMRSVFGEIHLEFTPDQLVLTTRGVPQRATWRIKQQEGNSLVLTTTVPDKPGHSRDLNVDLDGDLLKLGLGKQRLVFRRAKGPAPEPTPAAQSAAPALPPTTPPADAAPEGPEGPGKK